MKINSRFYDLYDHTPSVCYSDGLVYNREYRYSENSEELDVDLLLLIGGIGISVEYSSGSSFIFSKLVYEPTGKAEHFCPVRKCIHAWDYTSSKRSYLTFNRKLLQDNVDASTYDGQVLPTSHMLEVLKSDKYSISDPSLQRRWGVTVIS